VTGGDRWFGDPPIESVTLIFDPTADPARREALGHWFESILPAVNWRFHVYATTPAGSRATDVSVYQPLIDSIGDHVRRFGLVHAHLHLQLALDGPLTEALPDWEKLLESLRPFQREAYNERGESRFLILPIIAVGAAVSVDQALAAADFFKARLAKPSFYLGDQAQRAIVEANEDDDVRFYLDPDEGSGVRGASHQLFVNHVFETLIDRTEQDGAARLAPCRRHLVADQRAGAIYACFNRWARSEPFVRLADHRSVEDPDPGPVSDDLCAPCIGRSLGAMDRNLTANGRNPEGRRVYLSTAMAFAEQDQHRLAAGAARLAFEKSDADEDRAAALVHEGLSHLALAELEEAEARLELATKYTSDQGLVAYHRGVVQFAWRDYIEALDRFEEALAAGSPDVPEHDLCFQMALSHINLEEYPEARPYLERSERPGDKLAPVAFYRGVCDLAGGAIEAAMGHFREALAIGPAPEDLGRVLFYLGSCYKELDRFDEAIVELRKAVEADPDDLANHNLLGFCYYKVKRHEEAVACFRRAVEIDPTSGIDWANLGSNLRDLGRIEEAVEMYEKALILDPSVGFARDNLITLRKSLKEGTA
jgi:tetratricopeptide (TPR) repeat protein